MHAYEQTRRARVRLLTACEDKFPPMSSPQKTKYRNETAASASTADSVFPFDAEDSSANKSKSFALPENKITKIIETHAEMTSPPPFELSMMS